MSTIHETPAGPLEKHTRLPTGWSLADLQRHLGDIPAERIRLDPPPGYATEEDLLRIGDTEGRLYELELGVLVEKPMGWYESIIAMQIGFRLGLYLKENNPGQVLGESGSLKFLPGVVKIPDVSFVSWARFPREKLPRRPIPLLIPDLVVEVLSESNSEKEMLAKLKIYFQAGVSMVWYVEPATRTARSWTTLDQPVEIPVDGFLDGGTVLPGFRLSLADMFAEAERQGPPD